MESLNLNTLVNSLPAQQNAEKELMNDFKAAALSITTLYRSSRKNAKRAYNAGYATACQDLLDFIQQGVSAGGVGPAEPGPSNEVEGGGMTIGRVMDWTEARRDAIKVSEEDEEEDEEREKEKERGRSGKASTTTKPEPKKSSANATASASRISVSTLPTPSSPQTSSQLPPDPSSPSPPPSVGSRLPLQLRQLKAQRTPSRIDAVIPSASQSSNNIPSSGSTEQSFSTSPNTVIFPESPILNLNGIGQKRRHHVMIIDGNGSTTSTSLSPASNGMVPPGSSTHGYASTGPLARRRTRSSRNAAHAMQAHNQNLNIAQPTGEAMDVEDDGRERKRVTRR